MGHSRNSFSSFLFFHCIKEVTRISISRSCRYIRPCVTFIDRYATSQMSLSSAYQIKNIVSRPSVAMLIFVFRNTNCERRSTKKEHRRNYAYLRLARAFWDVKANGAPYRKNKKHRASHTFPKLTNSRFEVERLKSQCYLILLAVISRLFVFYFLLSAWQEIFRENKRFKKYCFTTSRGVKFGQGCLLWRVRLM